MACTCLACLYLRRPAEMSSALSLHLCPYSHWPPASDHTPSCACSLAASSSVDLADALLSNSSLAMATAFAHLPAFGLNASDVRSVVVLSAQAVDEAALQPSSSSSAANTSSNATATVPAVANSTAAFSGAGAAPDLTAGVNTTANATDALGSTVPANSTLLADTMGFLAPGSNGPSASAGGPALGASGAPNSSYAEGRSTVPRALVRWRILVVVVRWPACMQHRAAGV